MLKLYKEYDCEMLGFYIMKAWIIDQGTILVVFRDGIIIKAKI